MLLASAAVRGLPGSRWPVLTATAATAATAADPARTRGAGGGGWRGEPPHDLRGVVSFLDLMLPQRLLLRVPRREVEWRPVLPIAAAPMMLRSPRRRIATSLSAGSGRSPG